MSEPQQTGIALPLSGTFTAADQVTEPIHAQDGLLCLEFVDEGEIAVYVGGVEGRDWLHSTITEKTPPYVRQIGISEYGPTVYLKCINPGGGIHYAISP